MASKNLSYLDFAYDELSYFVQSYNNGMRYNAMVSQAQRICECFMKFVIVRSLSNNNEVMMSHNLRSIYDYIESLGIDLKEVRADIMLLNNYYTHTRYPGRDAFLASKADIEASHDSLLRIVSYLQRSVLDA